MKTHMIRVLLIEDDPMVQEINKQFVEKSGRFTVVGVADNGKNGIDQIRELKPDLVLLDIFMPHLNGLDTLRKIREEFAVDVIIISAANDIRTIQQMLQWGAIDYIIKPFTYERMKQSLENYCTFKNGLTQKPSLSQTELDKLRFGEYRNPENSKKPLDNNFVLPKGLNQFTLKKILVFLETQTKAVSAEEVADSIGMARVTARRYLEYLVSIEEVMLHVQYGGIGRPVNRYIRHNRDQKDQNK